MGYTVVAAHKAQGKNDRDRSPHFATVRPGETYNEEGGPMVANVGAYNLIVGAKDPKCFTSSKSGDIKWYYNPMQDFRCDISWIEKLGERQK